MAGTAGLCYAALVARIHIVGASGSGTTTLGVALARAIDGVHFDTDDFFWLPTDPPFTTKRPVEQRLSLLEAELTRDSWVLSGSLMGWGDVLVPRFDLVVFLFVPPDVRLERIMERERRRYGADIDPGGRMHENHKAFVDWARGYDTADSEGRSHVRHRAWIDNLPCPVVEITGVPTVEESVECVLAAAAGRHSD
ncbi:MAG TPA: AAA family ATPase [Caulobacteraceae bacterium]|nr:AAA family ATPase [Caulobacteraceae bacterium]